MLKHSHILGIVAETVVSHYNGETYVHLSFGRVIDALASRYERVLLCAPTSFGKLADFNDYKLRASNVQLVPQPLYESSLEALKHPLPILHAYAKTLKQADHIFIRGMLPYAGFFYGLTGVYRRSPVHWIVGNPVALMRSHRRSSYIKDTLSLTYAYQDRFSNRLGRRLTGGSFLCNGQELAEVYASPRTKAVVSSTITDDEFYVREDTCKADPLRVIFASFVRPEKGLEYLVEAMPKLKCKRPWQLTIVGPWEPYFDYKAMLDARVEQLGIGSCISWKGYVPCGPNLWEYLRQHDIFVLPTLSEGTPRVLVEARANSIPLVATNVGGIPTSVKDGVDGVLVPPKDSDAIASAIDKIASDTTFRRGLIQSGLESARKMTVECFAEHVINEFE